MFQVSEVYAARGVIGVQPGVPAKAMLRDFPDETMGRATTAAKGTEDYFRGSPWQAVVAAIRNSFDSGCLYDLGRNDLELEIFDPRGDGNRIGRAGEEPTVRAVTYRHALRVYDSFVADASAMTGALYVHRTT